MWNELNYNHNNSKFYINEKRVIEATIKDWMITILGWYNKTVLYQTIEVITRNSTNSIPSLKFTFPFFNGIKVWNIVLYTAGQDSDHHKQC